MRWGEKNWLLGVESFTCDIHVITTREKDRIL